jgi:hypothetical protein
MLTCVRASKSKAFAPVLRVCVAVIGVVKASGDDEFVAIPGGTRARRVKCMADDRPIDEVRETTMATLQGTPDILGVVRVEALAFEVLECELSRHIARHLAVAARSSVRGEHAEYRAGGDLPDGREAVMDQRSWQPMAPYIFLENKSIHEDPRPVSTLDRRIWDARRSKCLRDHLIPLELVEVSTALARLLTLGPETSE